MAFVGLLVRTPEVFNNVSFIVIFPLTFIANTFVPSENLPGPLQAFAEWNPVEPVTQAARELFGNVLPGTPEPTAWPLQNPVLYTVLWGLLHPRGLRPAHGAAVPAGRRPLTAALSGPVRAPGDDEARHRAVTGPRRAGWGSAREGLRLEDLDLDLFAVRGGEVRPGADLLAEHGRRPAGTSR